MLDSLLALDASIVEVIATLRSPTLDRAMLILSDLGSRGFIWLLLAGLVAAWRPRRLGGLWQLGVAVLLSWFLVDLVLKPLVARARPFETLAAVGLLGDPPDTAAFPSGHASTAFLGAVIVGRMWRRGRPLLWALAAAIAFSRVYLGVHYPLDVLAGALLGWALGAFANGGTPWDEPTEMQATSGTSPTS